MTALRTIEHFITQAMTVGGKKQILLVPTAKGFQASIQHADGSCAVDVSPDPVTALWNILVPHTMRRVVAPSGRVMIVDAATAGRAFLAPDIEVSDREEAENADLNALLGIAPPAPPPTNSLANLLG